MSELTTADFSRFLAEMYGGEFSPFPWQKRLLDEVMKGGWPNQIALPTASGKTMCIDIAIFALALHPLQMPRRIFFCVDRRVIVDAAHEKAVFLAERLKDALQDKSDSVIKLVAQRLAKLAGEGSLKSEYTPPLKAFQLRGGVYRDHAWADLPTVPLVVCTTVDQLGSRILFRGYGVSMRALPKHAGLVSQDSLVILDEAHCSRPLEQTLRAIQRYQEVSPESLGKTMEFAVMSATLADDESESFNIFRPNEDDYNHPVLSERYRAKKLAHLKVAKNAKGKLWNSRFAKCLADEVKVLVENRSYTKIAVMVNRVVTAREVRNTLVEMLKSSADVVLMTGRMRELDRVDLIRDYGKLLKSGSGQESSKPVVVVATQCLEVGADFDFDALITECASLDALRQRFGRLNRLGQRGDAFACVVIRADQINPKRSDPVYGDALAKTWDWLSSIANEEVVDFSIEAMDRALEETESFELFAPSDKAPILMPAHIDCLAQTNPRPVPEPDVSLFLRGPERPFAEVRVLWRDDLEGRENWYDEILSVVPPAVSETLGVPLTYFCSWLSEGDEQAEGLADVAGIQESKSHGNGINTSIKRGPVYRWRGADDESTGLITDIRELKPNDVLILQV